MRRRDLITTGPAALLAAAADDNITHAAPAPPRDDVSQVDVRRDFGAKGDGISDDWQAIENAGAHLERHGGGRMYFPTGRYRLATFGRNITLRNNIEYFGDGHGSVIIGSNAAFISPNGAAFGRSAYGHYHYVPIGPITAGDRHLDFTNAADASRFKPGDIVIARATDAIITPGDVLPYYVEMNRVAAVAGARIELEDAIDDGWNGLIAANVTDDVIQGYSIHDLRIECEAGYPFFIQGSYKSFIRNCWTRGFALACFNGFTRSMAHDIIAEVVWQPGGTSASLFEIETGSVRANFHDIDVHLSGSASAQARYPLVYCQEFSRRTVLRNIRIAAAGTDVGTVFEVMSGGHRIENVEVTARSVGKVLDYWVCEPSRYQLGHLGLTMSGVSIETLHPTNGFDHGFILHNDHPAGEVSNVSIRDCTIQGRTDQRERNLIWFYRGRQTNITFDRVSGAGLVTMNTELHERSPAGASTGGDLAYPLVDVMLRNCTFERLGSQDMLDSARYLSCQRLGGGLPAPLRVAGAHWAGSSASPQMALAIPPAAVICRGDSIAIRLSAWYAVHPFPAHLRIRTMGADVLALDLAAAKDQMIDIDLALTFVGGAFSRPDRVTITGPARVNNISVPNWTFFTTAFDRQITNLVEVQAWIDKPAAHPASLLVNSAHITFRAVESEM